MGNPLVSIIVPVFNAAKSLSSCINSILSQSFSKFELILVNDGSTDSSEEICKKFQIHDNRIKYFSISNHGAGYARNIGIDNAHGDYIWFIDADDTIDENFLNNLEFPALPDIIFFGFYQVKDISVIKCEIEKTGYYNINISDILNYLFISKEHFFGFTWNKIFKKDIINRNKIRFRDNLITKEDEVFTLEYCQYIDSVGILKETPYYYKIEATSVSHSNKYGRNMWQLAEYLYKKINWGIFSKELNISFIKAIETYYNRALFENINNPQLDRIIYSYFKFFNLEEKNLKLTGKRTLFLKLPDNKLKVLLFKSYLKFLLKRTSD